LCRSTLIIPLLVLASFAQLFASQGILKAASRGEVSEVRACLAAGESVNALDKNGWTPLMWSVYCDYLPVTSYLLGKGADPNFQSSGAYKSFSRGVTALSIACQGGQDDQAKVLLNGKAKLDLLDAIGHSAADYGRQNEMPTVLNALGLKPAIQTIENAISAKDLNATDKFGWTPLMWAVYNRDQPAAEGLLGRSADPDTPSVHAYKSIPVQATALIIASYYGYDDFVTLLLKNKAKKELVDGSGTSAEGYARRLNRDNVLLAMADRPVMSKNYSKLVIDKFEIDKSISLDYASAIAECQENAVLTLSRNKGFETVAMAVPGSVHDASTLLMKVVIKDISIPSSAARFFLLGILPGSTQMKSIVQLVDAATGKLEWEQAVDSTNYLWLSALTLGLTDQNFSRKMGATLANYVLIASGKNINKPTVAPSLAENLSSLSTLHTRVNPIILESIDNIFIVLASDIEAPQNFLTSVKSELVVRLEQRHLRSVVCIVNPLENGNTKSIQAKCDEFKPKYVLECTETDGTFTKGVIRKYTEFQMTLKRAGEAAPVWAEAITAKDNRMSRDWDTHKNLVTALMQELELDRLLKP